MTTNEIFSAIMSVLPEGSTMVRKSKSNFIAVPTGVNEDGVMEYAKVAISTLLSHDTKSNTAFNFDAAVAEYAEYSALQVEKASKPKTTKKTGPDPEKVAAKEARKSELFKWLMQNPGAHTCTDIKASMPDVYGEIVIMQVGSDAKSLAEENELIVREVIEGKNCYRYAGE